MMGVIAVGVAIIAVLVVVIVLSASRNRRLKARAEMAVERVEETVALQGRQQIIQGEADEEKESLEGCSDSDLPDRANKLFP